MRFPPFVIVVASLAWLPLATAQPGGRSAVPVVLASDDLDPCSDGVVAGLAREAGDGFLSVRDAPTAAGRARDRLRNGRAVHLCARRGDWIGIVYGGPGQDCGVTSPQARTRPYAGPCRSGWVHGRWIEDIAG